MKLIQSYKFFLLPFLFYLSMSLVACSGSSTPAGAAGSAGTTIIGDSSLPGMGGTSGAAAGMSGTAGSSGVAGATPALPGPIAHNPGNIGIPIESNCSVITDFTQRAFCELFVSNMTQFVFPAMEDISGLSLRDCLDRVRIEFNVSQYHLGQASIDSRVGLIQFNPELTSRYFSGSPTQVFDDHEPLHILYQCAHIPYTHNYNHSFFFAAQAELDDAIFARSGNSLAVVYYAGVENRNNVSYWYGQLTSDSTNFEPGHGSFSGCPGVASYLLFGDYVQPHHEIVRTWFATMYTDSTLASLPYASVDADARYVQLVKNLTHPNDSLISRLSPYCSTLSTTP